MSCSSRRARVPDVRLANRDGSILRPEAFDAPRCLKGTPRRRSHFCAAPGLPRHGRRRRASRNFRAAEICGWWSRRGSAAGLSRVYRSTGRHSPCPQGLTQNNESNPCKVGHRHCNRAPWLV
jgi:hypothetical protein